MRTMSTIVGIVLAIAAALIGAFVALGVVLGPWWGTGIAAFAAAVVVAGYVRWIGPWQRRWGATDEEVGRSMPGDDLVPGADSTTRAIGIAARPAHVWPWLVQIGYGGAGWYSYDWIDNDGKPSADRIIPELQDLEVGDSILMTPGMGPVVVELEDDGYILSRGDLDSWCLALYPAAAGGTRLVSRWRAAWPKTVANLFWVAIGDPGAFIMERRMLQGIKRRAERAVISGERTERTVV